MPAVAVKFAVLEPASTLTFAGIVRAALLLEIARAAPFCPAACDKVTVQVAVAPELSVDGAQVTEMETPATAVRLTAADCELPL